MDLDSKMSARSRNRRLIFPLITLVVAGYFVWTGSGTDYEEMRLRASALKHIQSLMKNASSGEKSGSYDVEDFLDATRQQQVFMDRQALTALEELIPPLQIATHTGDYSSGIRYTVEGEEGGIVTVVITRGPEVTEVLRGEE